MTARPFIVTRPAEAGESLTSALRARGVDAHWLPAFELGPAPDAALADTTLAQLADFDLAVFVSPAAVRATAQRLGARVWPAATAIGTVGSGTREAVRAHLRFDSGACPRVIAPDAAGDGADGEGGAGSEAFWRALRDTEKAGHRPARRVLLLRAEQGRDWLREHFAQAGAQVTLLPVYTRRMRGWSDADAAWVAARLGGPSPVLVITSSEAVDSLLDQADVAGRDLGEAQRLRAWLLRGRALAQHPRIVVRLQAAGFADAACVPCEVDALLAAA